MNQNKSSQIIAIKANGFENYLLTLPKESQENAKIKYASMATRFWFYAEDADGYKKKVERQKIINLIQLFFSEESLFPQSKYSIDERKNILKNLMDSESLEVNINEIVQYLMGMPNQVKEAFFYDGCLLVSIEGQIVKKEIDFLDAFAKDLSIQDSYKQKLYQYFWFRKT